MAKSTQRKAEREAQRLKKKAARDAAREEIMEARGRTLMGFGGTYLVTALLPAVLPSTAAYSTGIDLTAAAIGGYEAFFDEGAGGDYGLGAFCVGTTQTLDKIAAAIQSFLSKP